MENEQVEWKFQENFPLFNDFHQMLLLATQLLEVEASKLKKDYENLKEELEILNELRNSNTE